MKVIKRRLKIGMAAASILEKKKAIKYWSGDETKDVVEERFNGGRADTWGKVCKTKDIERHEINISTQHISQKEENPASRTKMRESGSIYLKVISSSKPSTSLSSSSSLAVVWGSFYFSLKQRSKRREWASSSSRECLKSNMVCNMIYYFAYEENAWIDKFSSMK